MIRFILLFSFVLLGTPSIYAHKEAENPEFQKNYKRYRNYDDKKKQRMIKKWSSFKQNSGWNELTPEQKRKLREKVLKKAQD